jgi:hypothetical protein
MRAGSPGNAAATCRLSACKVCDGPETTCQKREMGQDLLVWWQDVCGALGRARRRLDSTLATSPRSEI